MKINLLHLLGVAVLSALLCGCTTEQVARNVYDGIRTQNEMLHSAPPDYTAPRAPSYDDYERERRGL